MYARLTTIVFAPSEAVDVEAVFSDVLAVVEELDGFKGIVMFSGVGRRSLVMLTLWETAQALADAEPLLERLKRAETSFRQVEAKDTVLLRVAGWRLNL